MTSEELRSLFKGYLEEMGANQDPEIAARAFYEELEAAMPIQIETFICEECNEEKPWSEGSDSSPECDDCWAKKEENTHG